VPDEVRPEMEFVFAAHVHDVLEALIPGIKERMAVLV